MTGVGSGAALVKQEADAPLGTDSQAWTAAFLEELAGQ